MPPTGWVVAARVTTVSLLLVTLAGGLAGPADRLGVPVDMVLGLALGFTPVGLFLLRGLPSHPVARLTMATGLLAVGTLAAFSWSGTLLGAWLTQWLWFPAVALIPLTLLAFPDGVIGRASRVLAAVLRLALATGTLLLATMVALEPQALATEGSANRPIVRWLIIGVLISAAVLVLGALAAGVIHVRRARRSTGLARRQGTVLLPAAALLGVGLLLDAAGMPYALVPAAIALPLGIGAAVLRFSYGDLDLIVNRTLVWLVMTGLLIVVYVAVVTGISRLVPGSSLVATAVATALVAAAFDPARRRVERMLRRLLFGDRDAPDTVITRLSRQMRAAEDPAAMLGTLVRTVTEALQLPYARLVLDTSSGPSVIAEHGRKVPVTPFAITSQGESLGRLEVAPRRVGEEFTPAEHELLEDVAAAAGVAVHAHHLTLDLQAARQSLVLAREEERLRIRRDLHDGLGPTLVGSRMQVRAAQALVADEAAGDLLSNAFEDLTACSTEIRRIVDGLRPPALDAGLGTAVRSLADTLLTGLDVSIEIDEALGVLPPAIEVALYRIAAESLANVARHSGARTATVELTRGEHEVVLTVIDDGCGGARTRDGSVGLLSMRTRAAELGGTLEIHSATGTRVRAVIPLH